MYIVHSLSVDSYSLFTVFRCTNSIYFNLSYDDADFVWSIFIKLLIGHNI